MKQCRRFLPSVLGLTLIFQSFPWDAAKADPNIWIGGGIDLNWSTVENWTNAVAPTTTDDVLFYTNQIVADTAINNIISADVTIQSLRYMHTNLNSFHNTRISDGVTLTIDNATSTTNVLFVGTGVAMVNNKTTASISGANAVLNVIAPTGFVSVRQGGIQNFAGMATLDLSGLGTFSAQVQRVLVAGDGTNGSAERDRPSGTMKLARTNVFVLNSTTAPGWDIGQNIGNGGSPAIMVMGLTNAVFTDYGIGVGRGRSSDSRLYFGQSNSTAYFRNKSGSGRQKFWLIGDNSTSYSGNVAQGKADFAGILGLGGAPGTVDAMIETLIVGRGVNDTKGLTNRACDGTLTLGSGLIDVNTVEVGYQYNNYSANAVGLIRVIGTNSQMLVNNYLRVGRGMLVDVTNGVNRAEVDLENGAQLTVAGNIYSGLNGSNTVSVTGGSVVSIKGTLGNLPTTTNGPLTNFKLVDSTLAIDFGSSSNPTAAACVVSNLNLSGANRLTVSGTGLTIGTFPVLQYSTLTNGGVETFASVTVPPPWQGYLSNNTASSTIDLVLFVPLVIQNPQLLVNGSIGFSVTGENGSNYRILASDDIAAPITNWVEISTGTLNSGVINFIDTNATNFARRFYRAVTP